MSAEVMWAGSPLSSTRPSLSTSSGTFSPLPSPRLGGVDAASASASSTASASAPSAPSDASTGLDSTAALSAARERDVLLAEEAKVRSVQSSMAACQQLTDSMLHILEQFDRKLKALEASMQPLHKGTQQLINAHKSRSTAQHILAQSHADAWQER